MTGGKARNQTNQMIERNRQMAIGEHNQFQKDLSERLKQSDAQAMQTRQTLDNTLTGMAGRDYNVDPSQFNVSGDFGEARDLYRGFTKGGGVDEDRMRVAQPIFQDIANNQDIANRFRAGGTYEEFNRTGGISEGDKANIRSRGSSVIPAYYQRMKDEANRANTLQGGYGPGAGALKSRLARDQVAASQGAALDTELGIAQQVREGRMFGAQGMTGAEGALQSTRLGAGSALDASEANIQNTLQRGRMFGTSGIHGISSEEAAIAAANADRSAGIQTGNQNRTFGRDQTVAGMQGDLYNIDQGASRDYMGIGLADRGLTYDSIGSGINQRISNNPQTSWRDWVETIGNLYK